MYKIVYIDYNFIDKRFPNSLEDGISFFTYGFGSIYARKFKKYNPDFEVECWKVDSRIKNIYEKNLEDVYHIVFPSIRFGKLGHYSSSLIKHLKKESKRNSNIIFNISSIRHLLFYSLALRLKKYLLVVQHHGESSALHKTKINKGLKKFFYALQIPFERIALNNVNLFLVLDERIKNYLPLNKKNLKIELSTTGVDEKIFHPLDKLEAKKLLGWDINKKYILYVGSLNSTKRPDILIDIFEEFKKEGRTDIQLVLAGNEKNDPLYEKAKESGAILYGKILQTELYKYLSAADLYCLPKYKIDLPFLGMGMLPVQSLLCETPVVGNSLLNFPQEDVNKVGILTNNKSEIKNAIIEIIDKKRIFTNLREIALKYYSWEVISKNTADKYLQLIKEAENGFIKN